MKEKVKGLFFVAVLLGDCFGLLFFIIARAFDLWSELQVFPKIVLGYGGICLVITIQDGQERVFYNVMVK